MRNGSACNTYDHYNQLANTRTNTAYSLHLSAEACALAFTGSDMHTAISLRMRVLQTLHILSHILWSDFKLPPWPSRTGNYFLLILTNAGARVASLSLLSENSSLEARCGASLVAEEALSIFPI